ncbi:MAG: hypothetical protein OEW79_14485, partial [Betaproteobacteria bacterium]|nr:hypothetical protein [Betaproteobacteria bacterium]
MSIPRHTLQALTRLAKGGNAEIFAWGDAHVVKLFRPGLSRDVVDMELQLARIAHAGGIPTPR